METVDIKVLEDIEILVQEEEPYEVYADTQSSAILHTEGPTEQGSSIIANLDSKQDKIDPNLNTRNTTVVGAINEVYESTKQNSSDIYAIQYQLEEKPNTSDIKNGALSIEVNDFPITTFTANQENNSSINFASGLGIQVDSSPNNTITISTESNHTVIAKDLVVEAQNGAKFYNLDILCDLYGENVSAVNLYDFNCTNKYVENTFIWNKQENENNKYAGIFYASSTEGNYIFEIETYNEKTGDIRKYMYGLIADTPSDTTFVFVSTCIWDIELRFKQNILYGYLQIPDDFVGTIKLTPILKNIRSGSYNASFNPDYVVGYENNKKFYNWGTGHNNPTYLHLFSEDNIEGLTAEEYNNNYSNLGLRSPSGKYNVDIVGFLDENIYIGKKISDSIVNDFFIHKLSEDIKQQNKEINELRDAISVSGGGDKEVIEVDNEDALDQIEEPSKEVIYITADTGQLYIYDGDKFINVTNKQVGNTIYVFDERLLIGEEYKNGLYVVIIIGALHSKTYNLNVYGMRHTLRLYNHNGWAEVATNEDGEKYWEWHNYAYKEDIDALLPLIYAGL